MEQSWARRELFFDLGNPFILPKFQSQRIKIMKTNFRHMIDNRERLNSDRFYLDSASKTGKNNPTNYSTQ